MQSAHGNTRKFRIDRLNAGACFQITARTLPAVSGNSDSAGFDGRCYIQQRLPTRPATLIWASHLGELEKMVLDSELARRKWDEAIPYGVKPEAGNLKTVALSHPMRPRGIQGGKWIRQFPTAPRLPGNCRNVLRISQLRNTKRRLPAPAYTRKTLRASRKAQLNLAMQMPRFCGMKL